MNECNCVRHTCKDFDDRLSLEAILDLDLNYCFSLLLDLDLDLLSCFIQLFFSIILPLCKHVTVRFFKNNLHKIYTYNGFRPEVNLVEAHIYIYPHHIILLN